MDARTLDGKMNYIGMERAARRVLVEEKLATAEDIALMTSIEVCKKLIETYDVVSCENESINIVKKEDRQTYDSIVKRLGR